MDRKKVLCVGNAVLDQIYTLPSLPPAPGKYFASAYLEAGGGPAATASVAVARLGGAARLWSRVGRDPAGDRIAAELASYGVDLPAVSRIDNVVSSLAGIFVDARGERVSVNYLDPKLPQGAAWLPLDEVGGFAAVIGDIRWPAGTAAVLRAAAAKNVPTVLDADQAPTLDILQDLTALAGHVVFSEPGLRQFSGEASAEAGLVAAAKKIGGIPYVTLGGDGCLWLEGGRVRRLPAFTVTVADTTGAGDVFHGAFALGLAEGMAVEKALRFASGAAALKCTKPGGRAGIPDRAALEAFLSKP